MQEQLAIKFVFTTSLKELLVIFKVNDYDVLAKNTWIVQNYV